MKQHNFTESPIDHHIQRAVLLQLFKSSDALSFSELKPDDVDNSLFMYHVRKLVSRGLIEKDEDGYTLTANGARRVNFVSTDTLKPDLYPRALVSFIVLDETETFLLLSRRKSSAAGYVGTYILPAGRLRYGVSVAESATERARDLFGTTLTSNAIGTYETIVTADDGYVHHTLSFAQKIIINRAHMLPKEDHYELEWVPIDDIVDGTYGEVVQKIAQHYVTEHAFAQPAFAVSL